MDHLIDALPTGWTVICVGEERPTTRSVHWCRESPAGGGPVPGIAAGLAQLEQPEQPGAEICVVVGGDMPFAAAALPGLVEALFDSLAAESGPALDAVLAADPGGRTQPLLGAYRCEALRAALPPEPGGARLMAVVGQLVIGTITCAPEISLDVDTPEALEQARHIVGT